VDLVGIKQLGLPESITAKVFERMKAERDQLVAKYKGEGQQIAISINSEAQRRRTELLASANAAAKRTLGEADKAAAKDYEVFEQEPELAKFLLQNEAFREILTNRATLILDSDMSPFNLLRGDKITGGANK
jgi:membrane protease subunit HflC